MSNVKAPAYRQAGKVQMNFKFQSTNDKIYQMSVT